MEIGTKGIEMNKKIALFDFEGQTVRIIDRDGNPWFVLRDVCQILEIANPRDAASRLENDEKSGVGISDPHGRMQNTTIINESGLYNLIFTSKKTEAKRFRKWVTSEVLPEIRKTGSYHLSSDRIISKKVRNKLTSLCRTRGFTKPAHYINLTQKVNGSVFGVKNTQEVRDIFGFPPKSNVREELSRTGKLTELGSITITEGLTSEQISSTRIRGPKPIADMAFMAFDIGKEVRIAIAQIRKKRLT